jgi:lysophospholipase L1-like esterase
MWQNFVALGDSLTEGIGDPVEGYEMVGWTSHFVKALRQENINLRYTNLARRGLLTSEISVTQLEPALALKPDLVSVIAGGNDVLKGKWNPAQFEIDLGYMFEKLTASGATVLTATLPDFLFLPVPERLKERLTANIIEMNQVIRRVAQKYNAGCGEGWNEPAAKEASFWSTDWVHPNAYGYTILAQEMLSALQQWEQSNRLSNAILSTSNLD